MEISPKIVMHGIESSARTGQHLTTLVSEKSSDTNLNAIVFTYWHPQNCLLVAIPGYQDSLISFHLRFIYEKLT